ncbi:hypothetical protein [Priestia megaterium]|uniref:hypothetical protein n=1 Tax=Priestia megaterium TaxID=1404 RepID=UPI000BF91847|nr:hypothetical protein [Priestia megaterium]PFR90661.1 hypothetical protein COK39_24510 [Priestia megaterium]
MKTISGYLSVVTFLAGCLYVLIHRGPNAFNNQMDTVLTILAVLGVTFAGCSGIAYFIILGVSFNLILAGFALLLHIGEGFGA